MAQRLDLLPCDIVFSLFQIKLVQKMSQVGRERGLLGRRLGVGLAGALARATQLNRPQRPSGARLKALVVAGLSEPRVEIDAVSPNSRRSPIASSWSSMMIRSAGRPPASVEARSAESASPPVLPTATAKWG